MLHDNETAARASTFLLRVGAGLLFMAHGTQKLMGWFGGMDQAGGSAPLISQMGLAGVLETFGGALIVVGLFARPVAAVLFVEMIAAYVMVHAPQALAPIQNQGELALLYAVVFLFFVGHGAGAISLDALRRKPGSADVVEWPREREVDRMRRRAS
jgi:putative oxidoreductase